jgi:hypothetical protein
MGVPKDEGIKGERQDENKEETMEDRTGIERARRLETEADTESNQEASVIENERKPKTKEETDARQGISEIAENLKQTGGIGYVRRKTTRKDEKDDEKTTERRNRRTRDADTTKDGKRE